MPSRILVCACCSRWPPRGAAGPRPPRRGGVCCRHSTPGPTVCAGLAAGRPAERDAHPVLLRRRAGRARSAALARRRVGQRLRCRGGREAGRARAPGPGRAAAHPAESMTPHAADVGRAAAMVARRRRRVRRVRDAQLRLRPVQRPAARPGEPPDADPSDSPPPRRRELPRAARGRGAAHRQGHRGGAGDPWRPASWRRGSSSSARSSRSMGSYGAPRDNVYVSTLAERMGALGDAIPPAERDTFVAAAEKTTAEGVIPAYRRIRDFLAEQLRRPPTMRASGGCRVGRRSTRTRCAASRRRT